MFDAIREMSKSDGELLKFLGDASEYARFYLLSKRRQRGCDGMGEIAMIEEEFEQALNILITYCMEKGYVSIYIQYEIDSAAKELAK